jgi:phage shock protein PspC (stress-responsive transcriptional regulator)
MMLPPPLDRWLNHLDRILKGSGGSSAGQPTRLTRRPQRKVIGGVCGAIADYVGLPVVAVRLGAVVLLVGSMSTFAFLYLLAWVAIPKAPQGSMPDVSRSMRRKLRRIEGRLEGLHRRHDPELAALAQDAFNAIRLLAPRFEGRQAARHAELRETALSRFPSLLDNLAALPPDPGGAAAWRDRPAGSPERVLFEQLGSIRAELQQASVRLLEEDFEGARGQQRKTPSMAGFRDRLEPLRARLARRGEAVREAVTMLGSIETRLEFLLERIEAGGDGLDLRPFEVRKIAFEYLPDALERYLQLPQALAHEEVLADGRTATQALGEQIRLLDATLADLARSYFEKDARGLLVHGRFLREKFAEQPLQFVPRDRTRQPAG